MTDKNELVIFIPGMGAKEPEMYLEKLLNGLSTFCDGKGIEFRKVEDRSLAGVGLRRIEVDIPAGERKVIDVQEVYWGDLCPRFSSERLTTKLVRGFSLLMYWVISLKTWLRVWHNKYVMFNVLFTLVLLLAWYYGALAAALTAVGADTELMQIGIFSQVIPLMGDLGRQMGAWHVWAMTSLVMGVLPVTKIVDISYASKSYLQNRHGIFHKISGRMGRALSGGTRDGRKYDRITVLAHSFGAVVATETLANYSGSEDKKIRFITLGGPLLLITARSGRVNRALESVVDRPYVESWIDFYSVHDWMCSYTPFPRKDTKLRNVSITSTVPFDERVRGASHDLYFEDWEVLQLLLQG